MQSTTSPRKLTLIILTILIYAVQLITAFTLFLLALMVVNWLNPPPIDLSGYDCGVTSDNAEVMILECEPK